MLENRAGEGAAAALGDFDGRECENGFGAGADEGEETGGDGIGGGGFRGGESEAGVEGLPLLGVREEARVRREIGPSGGGSGVGRGGECREGAEGKGE